ncbi:hypothetical protein HY733_03890 [Candidatus Uhrbacteria bacterium]|nr:hypothetical protein [Candidatus Uhrbacteria bacterium]MBI4592560.1 hypothetical protein [Candidatus Uhrbacteria bacterium]
MMLLLLAQDIGWLSIGLAQSGKLIQERTSETSPEGYLLNLHQTLEAWSVSLEQIKSILVVTGPGSFTASRVSTTIANAIAFSRNIPIMGVENSSHRSLTELLMSLPEMGSTHVAPTYDRPPEITKARINSGDNGCD